MAAVTHKVVRGDTLSALARKYGTTVNAIAKLNNIKNVNLIYVGQVLTIFADSSGGGGGGGGSSTPTKPPASYRATIQHFGLQADTDRTVFATWLWDKSNTDKYQAKWWYDTGNGVWFVGSDSETTEQQSIYSAPQNALRVKFQVRPISKTYKSNDKDVHYWNAEWSTAKEYTFAEALPATPPAPTVTLDGYTLTAKITNYNETREMQFEVVQNDSYVYKTGTASVITSVASYGCTVSVGVAYKVRCRAKKGSIYSEWSPYSESVKTKPSAPSGITTCEALTETSVKLAWNKSNTAKTYDIEYATKKDYLGKSNASTILNNIASTVYTVTGLATGEQYFFRVRAVNDQGESSWTDAKSVKIGTKPEAPTTWSSTTTAIVGEKIIVYWVHNCEDASKESGAQLELTIGDKTSTISIGAAKEDDDTNRSYTINTKSYPDGTLIEWRIRTKGIIAEWGDWSVKRKLQIYAPPTLSVNVTDVRGNSQYTVTSFPIYIKGDAGPNTQIPISYHVSIISNESYDYWDEVGRMRTVTAGDEVYSKSYDTNEDLVLKLSPYSLDLENNVKYTVNCIVTMDTGLNATDTVEFEVAWTDVITPPNAEISYDPQTICTHIRPYCYFYETIFYEVEYDHETGMFYRVNRLSDDMYGIQVPDANTEIYSDDVFYETLEDKIGRLYTVTQAELPGLTDGVTLSVYRREYDGKYVEIAKGLRNDDNTFVTDPHPSLDFARYRIVAVNDKTGMVSFTDIPAIPIGEKSVVIQWDEAWDSFEALGEAQQEKPAWSGSMLKLPFNIDISEKNSMDVSTINYIGREHPVSYYGTQLGVTATWNVEIDKQDKNTLYGLRRLAVYTGDVYVREPSGSGYWANIEVSFSQTHNQPTIPVTLTLTRVEGGI